VSLKLPHRRDHEKIEATAEHRRREDAAPRLRDEVASLRTLRLHFDERREGGQLNVMTYSKPMVVDSAPASFEIRCTEPRCDGRHDLTRDMMTALRKQLPSYSGRSPCPGYVGDAPCDRVMLYSFVATYAP
jgi:hypothetical protein